MLGFRELGVSVDGSSSDPSRTSFRDADGQGIWKEIHTDSGGQCGRGGSVSTNILTPEQTPRPRPSLSSNSAYVEPPKVLTSPSNHAAGGVGVGRSIAVKNTTSSNSYYYNRPGMLRGGPKVPHSTQNVTILSPQQLRPELRPLETSPIKLTQVVHVANPRVTEELIQLSPEQAAAAGPAYDHDVELLHDHTNIMLTPAVAAAPSPHQVTLSSPMGMPMSSSTKPKKMVSKPNVDQTP